MIKKHEYNTLLKSFSVEQLIELYGEVRNLLACCIRIVHGIADMKSGEIDDVDLMDLIEDNPISINLLKDYTQFTCSQSAAINRALIDHFNKIYKSDKGVEYSRFDLLQNLMNQIVSECSGVSDEQAGRLNELANEMAGFCLYFLKFEFGIAQIADDLETKSISECTVNAITDKYCDLQQIPLETEVSTIMEASKIFRASLPLFDDYPELEEPFSKIMGPYISDIDEDSISIEMVYNVLEGNIRPEDVYAIYCVHTNFGKA